VIPGSLNWYQSNLRLPGICLGVFGKLIGGILLSDTEIRKAKPREAVYRMTDGGGLYLSVTPAGGKLWRWKYRFEGAEKLMSFGRYPDVPLVAARERHAAARRSWPLVSIRWRREPLSALRALLPTLAASHLWERYGWNIGGLKRAPNT
jgi:hypothetical protein